jgi:hypothetical protein
MDLEDIQMSQRCTLMNLLQVSTWFRLLVLAALVACQSPCAYAAKRCDYVEYQRLPLTSAEHGMDGALVLMRDRKFRAIEQAGLDDPETACNARFYLVDKNNRRIATDVQERPIARLETLQLIAGKPASFKLTVDYYAGMGSYSGPMSVFFDVVAGKIRWIKARNTNTRKIAGVVVMNSLKTEWKLVQHGSNKDILEMRCRPVYRNQPADPSFELTYIRYRYNGTEWIQYSRSEEGFWESEEGTFPDASRFPPSGKK